MATHPTQTSQPQSPSMAAGYILEFMTEEPPDPIVTRIVLNDEDWAAFQAALNRPAKVNSALRELFSKPSVFDMHEEEFEEFLSMGSTGRFFEWAESQFRIAA